MVSDSFHRRGGLFLLGEGGVVVAESLATDAASLAADAASLMISKRAVKQTALHCVGLSTKNIFPTLEVERRR